MLTGYNTDIKHEGTVYHIQTEDGGAEHPAIVSLIYVGGRILASKKTSYEKLLNTEGFMSKLRQLLEKQHKMMIKAVITGSIEEFKEPEHIPEATIIEEEIISPKEQAAAKAPPEKPEAAHESPARSAEKNLDQVILEYLASEMDPE